MQPSATHPPFWQTRLFTIFPIISTTNRGSPFWENREKAGLSKRGMSCRRLEKCAPFWSDNGVSCPCERNKIGDSALWSHACVFVNPSCNYFTKEQRIKPDIATHRHVISCVCFCKPNRPTESNASHRIAVFSSCDFDRHIINDSSWAHRLVISTDTSSWAHHLVISTHRSRAHHLVISTDTPCGDQKIARFRTHDLRKKISICEYLLSGHFENSI